MQIVGGVWQTKAAWRAIDWRPEFVGDHCDVVVPTPHGPIAAGWKREAGGKVSLRLALPPGIEARVILPGRRIAKVRGQLVDTMAVESA